MIASMTSLAPTQAARGLSGGFRERAQSQVCTRLSLQPNGDGWSLVSPNGELVFEAPGTRGRRRCLAFARAHGVLTIFG
jgi:hypothetical protein